MSYEDILQHASIFDGLSLQELALINSIASVREGNTGDAIFEEGSASDELYIVVSGEVDIMVSPSQTATEFASGQITITTLRRGQSFGEMALVSRSTRAATARCAQHDTLLLVVPRAELDQLCLDNPRLGYNLMRNLAADMARKMRATDSLIQERVSWLNVRP